MDVLKVRLASLGHLSCNVNGGALFAFALARAWSRRRTLRIRPGRVLYNHLNLSG